MDTIHITSKTDDYKDLAVKLDKNFTANLIYRVKLFLPTTAQDKSAHKRCSWEVLGNIVTLVYRENSKVTTLFINGCVAATSKIGNDTLLKLVQGAVGSEIKGRISVTRPIKRTLSKDIRELSRKNLKKSGIGLSSRFSILLKHNFGAGVKQGVRKRSIISNETFNYLLSQGKVKKQDYEALGNYYVKKQTKVFLMQSEIDPGAYIDEALAREPGFLNFYDENIDKTSKSYVLTKLGNLYKLQRHSMVRIEVR